MIWLEKNGSKNTHTHTQHSISSSTIRSKKIPVLSVAIWHEQSDTLNSIPEN